MRLITPPRAGAVRRLVMLAVTALLAAGLTAATADAGHGNGNGKGRGHAYGKYKHRATHVVYHERAPRRVVHRERVVYREPYRESYRHVYREPYRYARYDRPRYGSGFSISFSISNRPPGGYYYWDPYCDRRYSSLNVYLGHLRGGCEHPWRIQTISYASHAPVCGYEYDDGGWDYY